MNQFKLSFPTGKPVTGNDLVGRESVVKEIIDYLKIGQSVTIIAPRRFGKTSVILEVIRQLGDYRYFTVYIDLFTTPTRRALAERITRETLKNKKLDMVFKQVTDSISQIFKNIEFKQTVEDFDFILKFAERNIDDFQLLEQSVEFVNSFGLKNKSATVCAFDEFGDLAKMDGNEIVKMFRARIQHHQNTAYLFSGSYESVMNQLFIKPDSPFFRFVRVINLDMVPEDAFKRYLINQFSNRNIPIDAGKVSDLLNFTKGHPYYTQLLAQLIELNSIGKMKPDGNIHDLVEQAAQLESNYVEKIWEDLKNSREILQVAIAIVRGDDNLYTLFDNKTVNVSRAIRYLKDKGLVRKKDTAYLFTDPLVRYWIRRNVLGIDKTKCV
ncbi:MAG: hypothetical protein L6422_08475 [Candidatus Marinimicrobia bacterium]|nr:hypothetical protein [bacterium]MCG2716302.1 hypothetical protein [Candidatus Neomarinimicrobiota bacterium]